MNLVKMPRYIDGMPQLFFWELDEFMILAAMLGIGIVIGGFATVAGIFVGQVLVNIFRRYKDSGLPGQLSHLAHWKNIFNLNNSYPIGGMRNYTK